MDTDVVTTALLPSRQALLQAVLVDQYPKLNLNASSTILTTTIESAQTLTKWLLDQQHDMPRSVILTEPVGRNHKFEASLQKAANLIPVVKVQDESVTHAFSHIATYKKSETLVTLKEIFDALIPKGVAIVTVAKRNPVEEIVLSTFKSTGRRGSSGSVREFVEESGLRSLAEQAQFELGKIRVSEKQVVIEGEDLVGLKGSVEKILDGILSQTGDGHSWENTFDQAWSAEVERGGGRLVIEAYVLVAMKWDLLCA
ncbi:uncharacterized protein MYCFIDRAFT_210837 [Pseudocercospora fijiensis CIRAD86]|uniref:Uncharacterized protein n=1 Tax=Pseudocercospora fijiensis (strain CIRAD86) TaxID=383855 RepID=M3B4H9_PSEFD|nr:uncharacterized protein MYCFIDRAFT_210837 [Pseudocercospora fijiensis CIRAD86]EME84273.1 hypothetical protein MYCFIDRAFT_210837 [Pseudocercospora fijiensis CIRAD86]